MNPFGIAPLLDRGALRLDPYERFLIAKIKSGRYCPDLWNANSLYLNYPQRAPIAADGPRIAIKSRYTMTAEERRAWNNSYGDPALNAERAKRAAAKAEQEAEWARVQREWAAKREEKAKQEAERRAEWEQEEDRRRAERQAEIERIVLEQREAAWRQRAAEIEAERKAWQAKEAAAEAAYERETPPAQELVVSASKRQAERRRILAAPWRCKKCLKPATIEPHLGGFRLKCLPCDESTFGDHELLARVVEAQAA